MMRGLGSRGFDAAARGGGAALERRHLPPVQRAFLLHGGAETSDDARKLYKFNFTSGISYWTNNREMGAGSSSAAAAAYARSKPDIDVALARLLDPDPTPSSDPTWCASIDASSSPPMNHHRLHVGTNKSVTSPPMHPSSRIPPTHNPHRLTPSPSSDTQGYAARVPSGAHIRARARGRPRTGERVRR